jgi:hypothetical protein
MSTPADVTTALTAIVSQMARVKSLPEMGETASAMDRVSATNVEAASRLQQSCEGAHFAGTFGLHRTQGLAGVGIIGMVGKLLLLW